jgi:hypothetical protein
MKECKKCPAEEKEENKKYPSIKETNAEEEIVTKRNKK